MGICLILKVALSIYTALLDSGIETKEIGCSIGLVIVHTLLVTGKLLKSSKHAMKNVS